MEITHTGDYEASVYRDAS